MQRNMSTTFPLRTRQATGQQINLGEGFGSKQGLVHDGFKYRASKDYNTLPASIIELLQLCSLSRRGSSSGSLET